MFPNKDIALWCLLSISCLYHYHANVVEYGYSMQQMQVCFYKEVESMALLLPENSYPRSASWLKYKWVCKPPPPHPVGEDWLSCKAIRWGIAQVSAQGPTRAMKMSKGQKYSEGLSFYLVIPLFGGGGGSLPVFLLPGKATYPMGWIP